MSLNYKKGDIIGFRRRYFIHYGICIGNSIVVHKDKQKGHPSVRVSYINTIDGKPFVANDTYSNLASLQKENNVMIAEALSHMNDNNYNVMLNNCEHFVTEVKYGVKVSKQVQLVRNKMFIVLCTAFLLDYLQYL